MFYLGKADNYNDKISKNAASLLQGLLALMLKITICQATMFYFILPVLNTDDTISTLSCLTFLALHFPLRHVFELS